jgi:hypothetical protein
MIIVREHAIDREMDEKRFSKTKSKTRRSARAAIIKGVTLSILLKLNSDGTELRGHNGRIYVCSRDNSKIAVHTILKGSGYVV